MNDIIACLIGAGMLLGWALLVWGAVTVIGGAL